MRIRASLLGVSLTSLLALAGASAEPSATPPPDWGRQADLVLHEMTGRLHFTEPQVARIKPLLTAHLEKLRALFDSYAGHGVEVAPSLLQEFRETRGAFTANLAEILSPDQMKEVEVVRGEVDKEIKKAFCDARMAKLTVSLGLSDGQVGKARPIIDHDFDRRLEILSWHVEGAGGPVKALPLGPELQKLQAETDAQLGAVLTPEQLKKYQASP